MKAARRFMCVQNGSRTWICQPGTSPPAALIWPTGARLFIISRMSTFLCICRSTNQTYGSAKTPVIVATTPQEEDRLSAPDSASPASTPTGECLTLLH